MSQTPTQNEERIRRKDHRSVLAWIGVLTGPVAWVLQLYWSWAIGEFLACGPASRAGDRIFGFDMNTFSAMLNGGLLAFTVVAGVLSYVELRSLRSRRDRTPADRATWLARSGIMSSILFAVLIAVSFVPVVMIGGCG
ncbi:MAG TPA: hypothetical protein VE646_00760 [Actinomycetota bacterium]|jgi:hypothetical protein|nr:hypothetical protein [Actinomycetota bacterium]